MDNTDTLSGSRPDSPNATPKNLNSYGRNRYSTKYPVGPDDSPKNNNEADKSDEFALLADVKPPARQAAEVPMSVRETDRTPDAIVSEDSNDEQSEQNSENARSKNQSASGRGVSWREQKLKQGHGQRDGSSRSKSKSRSRRRSQRRKSVDVTNDMLEGEVEANKQGLNDSMDFPPPPPSFTEPDTADGDQKPFEQNEPNADSKQTNQNQTESDKPTKDASNKEDSQGTKPEETKKENTDSRDSAQTKFNENADLKDRRARRKTPSAPPTSDDKRSASRRGLTMKMDLNDDSESNSFTFVDSMYRAPRVVKWAAGGMTALILSMVFIALQHRLFGKEFVARKWMSIVALSVVVLVLLTMVFSSVNPVRFVRKFRSDAGRNQAEKEQRKSDLLKQF